MFQFLIGSLEAVKHGRATATELTFQFLIGSLEAIENDAIRSSIYVFQFLIGSLEATQSGTEDPETEVSIPHR